MPNKPFKRTKQHCKRIAQANSIKFKTNIKERYLNRETCEQIADSEKCTSATIQRYLKRHNIERRGRGITTKNSIAYSRQMARKKIQDIGYPLKKIEEVHHVDRNLRNNNIRNLIVFKDKSEHQRWHRNFGYTGYERLLRAIIN